MTYNRKIMRLELSAEKALNGGYYYAELLLPAADYEIKDATMYHPPIFRCCRIPTSRSKFDI